jgi:MFS transporter, UMF1 family
MGAMSSTRKKQILSWALYDWGNSAYSTTVMAGFFPIFFKQYWSQGSSVTETTGLLGTTISISSLLIALLSPLLGVIADHRGWKKMFCLLFTLCGALACAWMGFISQGEWLLALLAYGVAMMAYNAASVFYDSLLPSVAKDGEQNYTSALGYALGYLGGGVLFSINVVMFLSPSLFGLPDGVTAVKASFLTVSVWWLVFSWPLWRHVHEAPVNEKNQSLLVLFLSSFKAVKGTMASLFKEKNLFIYILSYWLYIDGVYTVMTMAVDYGVAIGLQANDLIKALLITQFIGFPCAYFFGRLPSKWGAKRPILFCILVYSIAVIAAAWMSHAWHFYLLATVIGMVQGGVQALSRSMFSRMIPLARSAEYFGFFNLVGRFASILGPLLVAGGVLLTGQSRWGLMGLLILFVLGGFLLAKVREPA